MVKPKVYTYEGRTFEVEVYSEAYGLIAIFIDEIVRPNRKFFGRTKRFYSGYAAIANYPSIDIAVQDTIAEGLEAEKYEKSIDDKWREWSKS